MARAALDQGGGAEREKLRAGAWAKKHGEGLQAKAKEEAAKVRQHTSTDVHLTSADDEKPKSIAECFAAAGKAEAEHTAKWSAAMDKLPVGSKIKGYTLTDVKGDKFWVDDKTQKKGYTHAKLLENVGLGAVEKALEGGPKTTLFAASVKTAALAAVWRRPSNAIRAC